VRVPKLMAFRETLRNWIRLIYFLGQNPITLVGAILTTTGGATLVAFWFYDFLLPGPPHPYIGILLFLILPGIFVLGLILIPIGILLRRQGLKAKGRLLDIYPEINLREPMVRHGFFLVGGATFLNILIFGTASYRGVAYMDTTQFCGQTCHTVMIPEFSVSKFAACPCRLRGMSHWPWSGVVRPLQTFRRPAGFCGDLSHLLAPHPRTRKVFAPGSLNL